MARTLNHPNATPDLVAPGAAGRPAPLSLPRRENPQAAASAVHAIRAGVRIIAQHPEIGRPAEDLEAEFREWPIAFGDSGYLALYRWDGETAVILALRHQKEVGY